MRRRKLNCKFCIFAMILSQLAACERSVDPTTERVGQVTGNSMEPSLAGERAHFSCQKCDLDTYFSPPPALGSEPLCPRCAEPVGRWSIVAGQWLRYSPVLRAEELSIGDVIVIDPSRVPNACDVAGLQVKRIVAGPGQSVKLLDGDLWVDGQRQSASISQFLQRAILVDKSAVLTSPTRTDEPESVQNHWLVYRHSSLYPRVGAAWSRHRSSLLDESPWDLQESRSFVSVPDFGVEIEFDDPIASAKQVHVQLRLVSRDFTVNLVALLEQDSIKLTFEVPSPDGTYTATQHGKLANRNSFLAVILDGYCRVRSDDQDLVIPLSNQVGAASIVTEESWPKSGTTQLSALNKEAHSTDLPFGFHHTSMPQDDEHLMALRIVGDKALRYRVSIKRDTYYRGPRGENEYDLPATQGFHVLGDHVAASLDSRQCYPDGIPFAAIVGRVLQKP